MADMDMIPRSYHDALRVRRTFARYGAALALVLAVGGAGSGWLRWRLAVEAPRLAQLHAASAEAQAMQARLVAAQQRKQGLLQASETLAALRASGTLARLSGALDGALNDRVWFDQLQFSRTQEQLRAPLPSPLPDGTLAVQAPGAANGASGYWRLASQVDISAQAADHEAMARFLGALSADPALADVRFLNSGAGADGGPALSFSVAGSLRAAGSVQ